MSKDAPDHHDAELVIKLYDLRRESVMRASRSTIMQWFPKTWEDIVAVTQPTHPGNVAWRQVSSYWEMVYGMARHGIVNADYFVENNAEGLFLFAKISPFLERYRKELSPTAFLSAEWITKESKRGAELFELIQARVRKMAETSK